MAATKREPLRPISSNAGTVERRARGGAAAAAAAKEKEKENEVPTEIGRGKDGGEKKPPVVVAVVVPPAPPLKPSSLQVRMKAEEEKEREEEEEGSSPAVALVAGLQEGQGRQDRKLAVARHRRRRGRSEFVVAQNLDGIFCTSDKNFLGTLSSNLVGSRYRIWGQGNRVDEIKSQSKRLLGVVAFAPTVTTLTGSFRSMRAWIPKNQSIHLKNSNSAQASEFPVVEIQHISGLPKDWQEKKIKADQLCSRSPFYNNMTKRYELDFRERAGRMGYKVQPSVKNFQMTLEEKGRQTILQLGRIGKSKYIMDFRYPLTGYQALCICLASIDSKLCCTL
ncbi:hypothetical protein OsJ_05617 [Oryza sativa Japonica Group]|uniref:Tubby C-terminal domain-containing protein n=1 Tax=Oryza sativa subsp. japonica TaxID=39947 RepID=A3A3S5_ORYSJ|nr:hypothetical protein OsJ_05617 [Oryza sativa Japonica Group]